MKLWNFPISYMPRKARLDVRCVGWGTRKWCVTLYGGGVAPKYANFRTWDDAIAAVRTCLDHGFFMGYPMPITMIGSWLKGA